MTLYSKSCAVTHLQVGVMPNSHTMCTSQPVQLVLYTTSSCQQASDCMAEAYSKLDGYRDCTWVPAVLSDKATLL